MQFTCALNHSNLSKGGAHGAAFEQLNGMWAASCSAEFALGPRILVERLKHCGLVSRDAELLALNGVPVKKRAKG